MSARALKTLVKEFVPPETQEALGRSPWLKVGVILLMLFIGPLLAYKGWKGIQTKTIVSKGREYTGAAALVISVLWVLTGLVMTGGAIVLAFVIA